MQKKICFLCFSSSQPEGFDCKAEMEEPNSCLLADEQTVPILDVQRFSSFYTTVRIISL